MSRQVQRGQNSGPPLPKLGLRDSQTTGGEEKPRSPRERVGLTPPNAMMTKPGSPRGGEHFFFPWVVCGRNATGVVVLMGSIFLDVMLQLVIIIISPALLSA